MKIASLVGARPQFIKEAMLNRKVREYRTWEHILINSGQHYDAGMSDIFFRELGLPKADYNLGVGSGSHAETTSAVMLGVEKLLLEEKPDALLVYGDTDTTLGGALAAAKIKIPVIHVEAGIRMAPDDMPEEINRRLVDRLSGLLFCCSRLGRENLQREGIVSGVHECGDIMLDVYETMSKYFDSRPVLKRFSHPGTPYIIATIHRDYNTDDPGKLGEIMEALDELARDRIVYLPLHPRTRKMLRNLPLKNLSSNLKFIEPLGYIDLMSLVGNAEYVITDSGGLQKEAYYAGKRALVVMPDTGWRELVQSGWNLLCAPEKGALLAASAEMAKPAPYPPNCYGEGKSARTIIETIQTVLN